MKKLYYQLPYVKSFEGRVVSCIAGKKGYYEIVLDQTAFFPEGGGQPYDTGTLNGIEVEDVQEKGGAVVHYVKTAIEAGTSVSGILNWESRYDNMQQHSGEHILTGLIHKHYGFDNVGFHMGSEEVTIDFNGAITAEQLDRVELEANRVIYDQTPFVITCPPQTELDELEYRSKKELTGEVRIVTIPGVDVCACCGTHVENAGEVGMIKILGMIRYKGGVRISILCGRPALLHYRKRQKQIMELSNALSAKPDFIMELVEKLKQENGEKELLIGHLHQELFAMRANCYPVQDEPLVLFEEQMTPVQLRQYCTILYEQGKGRIVLVCSGKENSYQYALGSAAEDMRSLSKHLNVELNGRGGGSNLMAQGTFTAEKKAILTAMSRYDRGEV